MPNKLEEIIKTVKKDIENNKPSIKMDVDREPVSLIKAIENTSKPRTPIIGELKYSSPSKGEIQTASTANTRKYISMIDKATGISILTEQNYFNGNKKNIKIAREVYSGPILRKDFIIDPVQIKETKYLGADAVLLITSVLGDKLEKYIEVCHENNLEALVEVRSESEIEKALEAGSRLIGINNRNLETLEIDLDRTIKLAGKIPKDKTTVSESGIKTKNDIKKLGSHCDAFLVGTTLMQSKNPREKLEELACA
ncbi:indole-3-glycerol-phosphate synthase [Methanonatronarchaeum sp. AMET6-2]|uniref:indole-3-glycerol phosphate synthase TrpC n=1 Tax=Methanonatronarchaeum sp. AMET6-2 TaxID=2933293 RepID=UPI0012130F5E|nr:indole-3-glycerol-phosphate synthase [Methanonatronarchaeum sp. AMET6-2]RZN61827.1 MAG: indole-3-glycerol-phosphate synthase [Methanonatronarchaeia archaeon]UOY09699.1 indole-3-glycerol-phosphate synthase [Methanonatronarchaeum sp. AMET6-2]